MSEATQTITVFTKDGLSRDFYGLPRANDAAQIDEHNNLVVTIPDDNNPGYVERRVTFAAGFWIEVAAEVEAPAPVAVLGAAA